MEISRETVLQFIDPACFPPVLSYDLMLSAQTTTEVADLQYAVKLAGACLSAIERGESPASARVVVSLSAFWAAFSKVCRMRLREMTA